MRAGTLEIELLAKVDKLTTDMKGVMRILDDTGASAERNAKKVESSFSTMQEGMKKTIELGKLLAEAFLLREVAEGVHRLIEFAGGLKEQARQLGVTAEQLQIYRYAASQTGVAQDQMETGLRKFTATLGKAAVGAEAPRKALSALGNVIGVDLLQYTDNAGKALPIVAEALAKIESPAKRAAVEVALFGKSGQMLDPLLSEGSKGIEEFGKRAQDLGLIMSNDLAEKAHEADVRMKELTAQLKVSFATEVAENADAIAGLASALEHLISSTLKFLHEYPKLALALSGVAIGIAKAGIPGGIIGGGVGLLAGAGLERQTADSNMDIGYRLSALNAAQEQQRRLSHSSSSTLFALHSSTADGGGLKSATAEVARQRALLNAARSIPLNAQLPKIPAGGGDIEDFLAPKGGGGKGKHGDHSAENLARDIQATQALIDGNMKLADAYGVSDAAALKEEITTKATAEAIKKKADVTEWVTLQIAKYASEQTVAAAKEAADLNFSTAAKKKYNDAVNAGTMTEGAAAEQMKLEALLRPKQAALALASGVAASKLKKEIEDLTKAEYENYVQELKNTDDAKARAIEKQVTLTRAQIDLENQVGAARVKALKGLNGQALEDELSRINDEQTKANIILSHKQELEDAEKNAAITGDYKLVQAIQATTQAELDHAAAAAHWSKEERDIAAVTQGVNNLIGALGNLGGIGSAVGQIIGALGNNGLVSQGSSISTGLQSLGLGSGISGILGNGLAGASFGSSIGGLLGSKTGGTIGGALGSLLGPIGTVVGSVLGGLVSKIASIFSGPDWGTSKVVNGKITTDGNTAAFKDNSIQTANSLVSSISSIASSLGKTVGNYSVSVGQDNGNWAVNKDAVAGILSTSGGDRTAGTTNFATQEEALAAAIKEAISQGAVQGLSEGAKTLLTSGTDITAQLAKAQAFDAVTASIAANLHPLGDALKALQAQFDTLDATFQEAGATTEDLAKLTKYEADQRKALADQFGQYITDNFTSDAEKLASATAAVSAEMDKLGMSGVTTKDQFLAITKGIDLTTDAGVALYESLVNIAPQFLTVANATDAAATAAAAAAAVQEQAAQQLQAANDNISVQILDAMGNKSGALALKRMLELNAITDDSTRALQMQLYVAQDVATARDVLTASYQRERAALVSTAEGFHSLAASLMSVRQSIYANDNGGSIGTVRDALAGNASGAGAAVSSYLSGAKNNARTLVDYQREMGKVAALVDQAVSAANANANGVDGQIYWLDKQVSSLIDVNTNVVSVNDAVNALNALLVPPTVEMADLQQRAEQATSDFQKTLVDEVKAAREENKATSLRLIELNASMDKFWKRAEVDGLTIKGDRTQPVYTVAA